MAYSYYYPPNFSYHYCMYMPPEYVEGKMVVLVRNKEGEIVNSFEFKRVDETPIYCALITTPEEEDVYIYEIVLVDPNGNIISFLEYDVLIVSNTESPIGWLRMIWEKLKSIQGGTTAPSNEKLDEILEKLNSIQAKLGQTVIPTLKQILNWLRIRKA